MVRMVKKNKITLPWYDLIREEFGKLPDDPKKREIIAEFLTPIVEYGDKEEERINKVYTR